jgi:DNA-binding transcriptional ArsR family regulator
MSNEMTLDINDFIVVTKALSDPNRVRAFMALRNGELCVCQIIELLALAPSTVSKHMSILKQAGLVDSRKDSRWVYYRLIENVKQENGISTIINLAISFLEQDKQILCDDMKLVTIGSEGLDLLCKRQRCTNG